MTTSTKDVNDVILHDLQQFETTMRGLLQSPDEQLKSSAGDLSQQVDYNTACHVFNRRFQEKPWFIVYCRRPKDVTDTYNTAIEHNLRVRIRAGGHDHEGECTGTNTILIDVSQMNDVTIDASDPENVIAHIGPGNIFEKLTTDLADKDVMIPHGTCATVGISGFVMGGGWGPWTRKMGMCCEWLDGADIVLGDGTTECVDAPRVNGENTNVPDLLWALRGGGGMSYGLVTELRIKTFELPDEVIRFDITWNPYLPIRINEWLPPMQVPARGVPTVEVLKAWEASICSKDTPFLIGTNLMINALPWDGEMNLDDFDESKVYHNCKMYGYWEGNEEDLKTFVKEQFGTIKPYYLKIDPEHGGKEAGDYGKMLMSNWARESYNEVRTQLYSDGLRMGMSPEHESLLAEGKPLPPDYDNPAPHKITSRLVNPNTSKSTDPADKLGLGIAGRKALLASLCSPLLNRVNRSLGLFTYVTLGAITGDYYQKHPKGGKTAFPYADKLYTIQYQCWWNTEFKYASEGQNNMVYDHTNRALDWMEIARDYEIPNTSGAFISFKDSSIPTETYFGKNYQDLLRVKKDYVKDEFNHLRIRKGIK